MAARGDNIVRYVYRGEDGERIPADATKIFVVNTKVIRSRPGIFRWHSNIIEVICHDKVEKIGEREFELCTSLKRLIIPGVKIVDEEAFSWCEALTDVECGKLEIMKRGAFGRCESLRSINLPSARIVEGCAFYDCKALTDVKFGDELESIEDRAFYECESLERITIPLKDGMFSAHDTFQGCGKLVRVDLVEGAAHETIAALQLEEWRHDVNEEIDSINRILPTTYAGYCYYDDFEQHEFGNPGKKAWTINTWIHRVLDKIIHYQEEHDRFLNEAATILQFALPRDILMNNVLSFLDLPHTYEDVDSEEEDSDSEDELEVEYSSRGEYSEQDSEEEGGEEDDHPGEERNDSDVDRRNEDHEEYDEKMRQHKEEETKGKDDK